MIQKLKKLCQNNHSCYHKDDIKWMEDLSFPSFPRCNVCSQLPSLNESIGKIDIQRHLENFYSWQCDGPIPFMDLIPEEMKADMITLLSSLNCNSSSIPSNPLSVMKFNSCWDEWTTLDRTKNEVLDRIERYLEYMIEGDPESLLPQLLRGFLGITVLSTPRLISLIEDVDRSSDTTLPKYSKYILSILKGEKSGTVHYSLDELRELLALMRRYTSITDIDIDHIVSLTFPSQYPTHPC